MLSEKWLSYSISKIHLILKIQENQQELTRTVNRESKRESGHGRFLYWFTQQQGYVQSLPYSKDFTKMINLIKFTTLAYNKITLHTAATTADPTADQETPQNPLCASRTPLLNPTASHSYTESTV